MSLQSLAVLLPYTDTFISSAQLDRLKGLPTTPKPLGLKWVRRRLVVTSATPRRQEPSKEISLDKNDLMALEFGRLLGESKEQTISKVLRRKIDPASTYIGIEKQAKGGKEIISKSDFSIKVERPQRGSVNASTLGPDLPRLASPPSRQNGLSINLPKPGGKVSSQADREQLFDDSMLRKPSSSQSSQAALPRSPFTSPAVDSAKRLGSQFETVMEERNEDLEMLRRPSVAKGQEVGKSFSDSSDQVKGNKMLSAQNSVTKTPSQKLRPERATMSENSDAVEPSKLEFQRLLDKSFNTSPQKLRPEVTTTSENSDSMEASKLEFQRLLDKSFHTSSASSIPNIASPLVRQNNVSRETARQDSRLELPIPKRPHLPTLPSQSGGNQPSDDIASPLTLQFGESLELQDDKSLKTLKEDFQHKLDAAPALPELVSPPSRHKGSIGTFVQPARSKSKARPSSMNNETLDETSLRKPRSQASDNVTLSPMQHSEEFCNPQDDQSLNSAKANLQLNLDEPSAIPSLAAPPTRNTGSFGTFVQPGREKIRGISSPSKEVADEPSAVPSLAAPPSRHTGSFGTFVKPGREKIRGILSPSKEIADEGVDEYLLQKPSLSEEGKNNMDSTALREANTEPLSSSKQMQSEDEFTDDLLCKPLMEADTAQTDVKASIISEQLKQNGASRLAEKGLQLKPHVDAPFVSQENVVEEDLLKEDHKEQDILKENAQYFDVENSLHVTNGSNIGQDEAFATESEQKSVPLSPSQFHEELSQPSPSNGLDDARSVSNGASSVDLSGGLQDDIHSSGVQSVKVAALKKPVRVSSSDSTKGHASEGKNGQLDSLQDSGLISDVTKQSSDSNAKVEEIGSGKEDVDLDLKTLQRESQVEESVGSQSLTESIIMASSSPEQVSFKDQNRDQTAHGQLTAVSAVDRTNEVLFDEATYKENVTAAKESASSANLVQQSKKTLRRPSQLTNAELLTQRSEQMGLQASNTKLHQAKEEEETEWARAEALLKAKEQVEVKLIGSNSAGLFVSFGCLVGFLPSFELSPKRGLVDFASWTQQKGIDLSQKRGLLNGIVNDAGQSGTITQNIEIDKPTTVTGDNLNDLKNMYKEEVSKLMSSFVGEKTKVIVKLLDKSRRKLKFSEKEADPGCREHVQKKANLMSELKLGEVVTCEVKSITPIGVFVEVYGVPALIHHSEVSWNTRVDPAALLNVGEVIKAKVCRLDRTLQRISLSLKQMQLDPLKRTLESVVGEDPESDSSMREVEAIESMEVVWPELGDLMKKLEKMDHISSVSRGRCLYSAAFAPTFQVLISTPQSNGYKLLARFGNKIQEVLVDTTLDRDRMKECIRLCTFSEA